MSMLIINTSSIVHTKHVHTMNYVSHQMCGKIFLYKHYLSSQITFLAPNECNHNLLQTKSCKSTKARPSTKTKTFSSHHFSLCYCSGWHTFDNPNSNQHIRLASISYEANDTSATDLRASSNANCWCTLYYNSSAYNSKFHYK